MKITIESEDQDELRTLLFAHEAKRAVNEFNEKLRAYDKYAELGDDVDSFVCQLRQVWFEIWGDVPHWLD